LSDLANFHLSQSSPNTKTFTLPKLGVGTPPKFTLPKLGVAPKADATGGLAQLANLRLQEGEGHGSKFVVPKLFDKTAKTASSLTPLELSLKKIQISEPVIGAIDNPTPKIDLTTALVDKNDSIPQLTARKPDALDEPFRPQFVDCDLAPPPLPKSIAIDCFCQLDISSILHERLAIVKPSATTFGRIMCRRFGQRRRPYVPHGFTKVHEIVPFRFVSLSPDDVALQHLKKGQK
jgi:hypothetical protein